MSRYFTSRLSALTPYTPGEQPRSLTRLVKLNTNESPFPPSAKAQSAAAEAIGRLQLYSDPTCKALREALADNLGVSPDEVILTNGSDEILQFAFLSYCDENSPAAFADITYGFYPVFAALCRVPSRVIPLRDDFTLDPADYMGNDATVVIANPNAPTGICLPLSDIERILEANPDHIVVVDEAYIDFADGFGSAATLIHRYSNLLVTRTFSKSRSMAGARLGYGIACAALIRDLETIRYSTNPYNVNSMTMAAGIGALADEDYTLANCRTVIENRAYTTAALRALGFEVLDSAANFVFARHPAIDGGALYEALKARGILVRHFTAERIAAFNRITIGNRADMDALLDAVRAIFTENNIPFDRNTEETPV